MPGMDSMLKTHRKAAGLALAKVARDIDVNRSTLHRIECGDVAPTRQTARALFDYYEGAVPLAAIYDPEYAAREAALA